MKLCKYPFTVKGKVQLIINHYYSIYLFLLMLEFRIHMNLTYRDSGF
jgi:hypothetical protein